MDKEGTRKASSINESVMGEKAKCPKCKKVTEEFYAGDRICKACRKDYSKKRWNQKKDEITAQWRANRDDEVRTKERSYYNEMNGSRKWKLANSHKKRAAKFNVSYEFVDIELLFERDKGTCQICQLPVVLRFASQDLIVPMYKGGGSTWDNSQLTHLACNLRKDAKHG